MDPVSITASFLALVGATGVVGRGLGRLASIRDLPNVVLELNDEVRGLHLIVHCVDFLTRHHSNPNNDLPTADLLGALEKSRSRLQTLDALLVNGLTVKNNNGETRLDRSVWLQRVFIAKEIKEQWRDDRTE